MYKIPGSFSGKSELHVTRDGYKKSTKSTNVHSSEKPLAPINGTTLAAGLLGWVGCKGYESMVTTAMRELTQLSLRCLLCLLLGGTVYMKSVL